MNETKNNIPNSSSLFEIVAKTVETNTKIISAVVKNTALYAASIVSIPLYMRAVRKLYSGYIRSFVLNPKIFILKKILPSINEANILLSENVKYATENILAYMSKNFNIYFKSLISSKFYIKALKSILLGYFNLLINNPQILLLGRLLNILNKITKELGQNLQLVHEQVIDRLRSYKSYRSSQKSIKGLFSFIYSFIDLSVGNSINIRKLIISFINIKYYEAFLKLAIPMLENISSVVSLLQSPRIYKKSKRSINKLFEFINVFINGIIGEENYKERLKKISKYALYIKIYDILFKVSIPVIIKINDIIKATADISRKDFRRASRNLERLPNLIDKIIEFLTSKVLNSLKIKDLARITIKIALMSAPMILLSGMLAIIGTVGPLAAVGSLTLRIIITNIMKIFTDKSGNFDQKKADAFLKAINPLKIAMTALAGLLVIMVSEKVVDNIKAMQIPITDLLLGLMSISIIIGSVTGLMLLMGQIADKVDGEKVKILMTVITSFITAWTAAKIAETVAPIGEKFGDVMLGIVAMGITISAMSGLMLLMGQIADKVDGEKVKILMTVITSFITAWAAAKIAETVAPIGEKFGDVMLGLLAISIANITIIGILKLVDVLSKHINGKKVKIITTAITSFITAWVSAKIAETVAPLGKHAKEIFIGVAVIAGVTLTLCVVLWMIQTMIKHPLRLLAIAIALPILALSILVTLVTLSMAIVFAPFALLTMSAVLLIAGMIALIGLIWKPITKGSLVLALIGIAMYIIAGPILVLAIAGALLSAFGGGPKGAILIMAGIAGFILAFAAVTALVGALAETGLIEIGVVAMIGIGVAMAAIALPLIIFAQTIKTLAESIDILTKLEYSEDIFAKLVRSMVKAFGAINEVSLIDLMIATEKFANLYIISASIGKMATVVRDVASLSIPTEFNEEGKPTAWTRMKDEDFENAAINASAITRIFAYMFSDKKHKLKLPGGRVMELGGTGMLEDIEKIRGKHKRRMKKLMKMVQSVGEMATVMQDLASMRIPETFDEKGNPTSWKKMDTNDFENAALNASVLMRMFVYMFDDENQHKLKLSDGSVISLGGTGISKILEDTKKRSIKKLKKIFELAEPMCKMVETIANVANLKMPETIDEKTGEVTKWKLAKIEDINGAVEKILEYTKTYIDGFDLDKGKGKTVFDKLDDVKKRSIKKMNSVFELITPISTMMDTIIKINTGKYPVKINPVTGEVEEYALFKNLENSTEPVFAVLNGFINGMTSILDNPNISKISDLPDFSGALSGIFTTDFEKYLKTVSENQSFKFTKIGNDINTPAGHAIGFIAKSIFNNINGQNLQQRTASWKQATDDSVKLVKSINTLDVSKSDSLKNLLHELYLFSDSIQGNFDKLAEVINEKLIDALEKLDGTLNKVNEKDWNVGGNPDLTQSVVDASKFTPTNKGKDADVPKDKAAQEALAQKKQIENLSKNFEDLKSVIKKLSECVGGGKTLSVFVEPVKKL